METGVLDRDEIARALRVGLRSGSEAALRIGTSVEVYAETASTNDLVERRGHAGAPEGLVIFAEHQTSGRGRKGNEWVSPKGVNLLFSALLRPASPFEHWPRLAHAVGVSVARAIQPWVDPKVELKWPNDVLIGGRKIAGILVESHIRDRGKSAFAVLGIGLNVNLETSQMPTELREAVTSIRNETGQNVSREGVAGSILAELNRTCPDIGEGFQAVRREMQERSFLLGHRVRILQGGRERTGVVTGFGDGGEMLFLPEGASAGETEAIVSADLVRRL